MVVVVISKCGVKYILKSFEGCYMWKGCGRSGYGDQAILGDYNDWDGLSMNGRQWKNRETKDH